MLNGIHFLLTYTCNFGCDHCFLHCSPSAKGVFTLKQLEDIMENAVSMKSVDTIFFEGGEPFLYYPLMVEAMKSARNFGFEVGVVTNSYWATSVDDAVFWLKPLKDLGISYIGLSDDTFHYGNAEDTPPKNAHQACKQLDLDADFYCIDAPTVKTVGQTKGKKGEPIVGGNTVFKGRAVETLTEGLPQKNWQILRSCTREELINPRRVHIDPFGNVHVCQGLIIGNVFQTPLAKIMKSFDAAKHPVVGPLIEGGPACLAEKYKVPHKDQYVDECHFCYTLRKSLLDEFPEQLAPRQVYGLPN